MTSEATLDGLGSAAAPADSPNLDVLRSLAVSFVVLSHLPVPQGGWLQVYSPSALGLLGVIIFFVHTCLVLMISLERQAVGKGWRHVTCEFLVRRWLRIYPLSIPVVLVTAALAPHFAEIVPDRATLLANLFLVQNLTGQVDVPGPLWSLPFELQMYVALPALFFFVRSRRRNAARWVFLIWCASAGVILALWFAHIDISLVRYLPCFLPGVLAYALSNSVRGHLHPLILVLYVALIAVILPLAVARGLSLHRTTWIFCLGLGLLIPLCRELRAPAVARVAKLVARYSYGVYLLHWLCMDVAFRLPSLGGIALRISVFILGLIALPILAYHLVEKPGIGLGKRVVERWRARGTVLTSADQGVP